MVGLQGGEGAVDLGFPDSGGALAAIRAPVEQGFAYLKNRRVPGKARTVPKWATVLVRTLLVLTNREVAQ
jgi:hypothetical protein